MAQMLTPLNDLAEENQRLLAELEIAYKNLDMVLELSAQEKKIAYQELQQKFHTLQRLYAELSNKENMLIHLEKLSSIGQFITEIIHELNSPLVAIAAHAELALMMAPAEKLQEEIRQISKQTMRMSDYLIRFRTMAYKTEEHFCLFDLNENLVNCLATIEIIKPNGFEIMSSFHEHPLVVKGDPYQANQIFLNLARNAFDAMQDHGKRLQVSTKPVTSDQIATNGADIGRIYCQNEKVWQQILNASYNFAMVEFADEGTGISPEHLEKLFQAFFTTKAPGKGTGLGLSISSDIVKRHGGNLAVKSVLGKGTTFQLLLPMVSETEERKIA
jgi:signal transduction histidine kinase